MKNMVILYGGEGSEHEVSVNSAKNVIGNIDRNKYDLEKVYLDKKNNWYLNKKKINSKKFLLSLPKSTLLWPIFHGPFGEGGTIQKLFEKYKLKFVGTGAKGSKLAMDKLKTQKLFEKHNIIVPKTYIVNNKKFDTSKIKNYPVILKPIDSGSSVDLYKCINENELKIAVTKILNKYKKVMLQDFIVGREFTCGVIEKNNKLIALPPTEIIVNKTDVFDYKTKYSLNGCLEVTPAKISPKLNKQIVNLAINTHKLIGCKDISRTDVIVKYNGEIVVLEINTIPGMTSTSFIPKQLEVKGIKMSSFVDIIYKNNF